MGSRWREAQEIARFDAAAPWNENDDQSAGYQCICKPSQKAQNVTANGIARCFITRS